MSTPAPQTPFEKFQALAAKVVSVPKKVVDDAKKADGKKKQRKAVS